MKKIFFLFLILICLALAPLVVKNEYVLNLLIMICLYSVLSHGWSILGGYTGQVSLGHSTFFGMGALVFRYSWSAGLPPFAALVAGAVASLVLAAVIGIPALKLKGHYFAIGTLALAMIAQITVQNILPGVSFLPPQYLQGYSLVPVYYMALVVGVIATGLVYLLSRSKLGIALLCVRENEEAAEAIGVNTFQYKVISLGLSTLLAGLGGGVFSYFVASYYYYVPFDLGWSFDPVLISFIGGAGTVWGPILGSFVFVVLKELFAISLGQMNVLIFGVVFILTVLFFPKGIIGIPQLLKRKKRPVIAGC